MKGTRLKTRRASRLLLALGLLIVISGCSSPAIEQSDRPGADPAPAFANEEEAFSAASSAFESYVRALDEVASSPQSGVAPLEALVGERQARSLAASAQRLEERGLRGEGTTRFDGLRLESFRNDDRAEVMVFLCLDVSDTRVLDSDGVDVTPTDRAERSPVHVVLRAADVGSSDLVVEEIETWTGDDFC